MAPLWTKLKAHLRRSVGPIMAEGESLLEAVRRSRYGRRSNVRLKRCVGPVMAEGESPLEAVRRSRYGRR
jgi:hypothetical protein